jgi:hypothetical protein
VPYNLVLLPVSKGIPFIGVGTVFWPIVFFGGL